MLLSCAAALAGCETLPSQGPGAVDVVKEANYEASATTPRYLVAELDQRALTILQDYKRPSFSGSFGMRGGAASPVIGLGDTLSVTVWEAAAGGLFSSAAPNGMAAGSRSAAIPEQSVGKDGSITVPYAGRIRVVGLTTQQVERAIVSRLMGKAIEPQALVTVPRNVSSAVTVTGEVSNGSRVALTAGGDRILDVIASAGGLRAPVHETFIAVTRGNQTVRAPMQLLLARPSENIYLRPRDVLTVVRDPQTFTAFGATGKNAHVTFDAIGITLEEALAKVGGLLDSAADPSGVFLLRTEPVAIARRLDPAYPIPAGASSVNVVYRINLRDAATYFVARKFDVRNKDVMYVAHAPTTEFYKAMQLFQTLTGPALTGAMLAK
jgi:polysaccharide export outer membrane protein